MARPSLDRMTAFSISTTLVTRSSRSQSSSLAGLTFPRWVLRSPRATAGSVVVAVLGTVPGGFGVLGRVERRHRGPGNVAAALPASLQGSHRAAGCLGRRRVGLFGLVGGGPAALAKLRGQAGLPDPHRQAHLGQLGGADSRVCGFGGGRISLRPVAGESKRAGFGPGQ